MTARWILLTLCMLGVVFPRAVMAQSSAPADPVISTWKLNPAQTRASSGAPLTAPAQRTEIYRRTSAGDIELELRTTAADGSTSTSTLAFSARGGLVRQPSAPAGHMLVETRLGPREWLVTYLADGAQYMTMRKVISEDGRIMRQSVTGYFRASSVFTS